jgi:redox-sensitive bicupin YhaK (pirin superfamily)
MGAGSVVESGAIMGTAIDVRQPGERLHTTLDWLDSWHSFSFGHNYDPANVNHGLLIVHNDDTVEAGRGFGMHSHRDMEIVTWVLEGELRHRDSEGNDAVIYPGLAQRMSAGTGITHSEWNASETERVHFLQMWVPPDVQEVSPGYQEADVTTELAGGSLVRIAGSTPDAALHINQGDAELWIARAPAGSAVTVPDAAHVHVFVARGDATLDTNHPLSTGAAARLTDAGTLPLDAGPAGAELVIWTTA